MKVKDVLTLYFIPQRNSCGIRTDGKVCICLKKTCIKCFFLCIIWCLVFLSRLEELNRLQLTEREQSDNLNKQEQIIYIFIMDECFICSIITNIEPLNKKKAIRLVYPWTGHTGLALSSNVSQLKLSLNYLILSYLFLLYADFRIGWEVQQHHFWPHNGFQSGIQEIFLKFIITSALSSGRLLVS